MEERLIELEMRVAYQDKLIAELDDVVRGFANRVIDLERQLGELRDSVGEAPIGPADERPPHY